MIFGRKSFQQLTVQLTCSPIYSIQVELYTRRWYYVRKRRAELHLLLGMEAILVGKPAWRPLLPSYALISKLKKIYSTFFFF